MMKKLMLGALLGCVVATQAMATQTVIVTVSCFRGPWKEVIWDRPNPIFIDSLMNAGYSITTSQAIAERACRDPSLVYQPQELKTEGYRLLRLVPPDGPRVRN